MECFTYLTLNKNMEQEALIQIQDVDEIIILHVIKTKTGHESRTILSYTDLAVWDERYICKVRVWPG